MLLHLHFGPATLRQHKDCAHLNVGPINNNKYVTLILNDQRFLIKEVGIISSKAQKSFLHPKI